MDAPMPTKLLIELTQFDGLAVNYGISNTIVLEIP